MTSVDRNRLRQLPRIAVTAVVLGLVPAFAGCILFEDPAEVEAVDGVIVTTSDATVPTDAEDLTTTADVTTSDAVDADTGDLGECSESNPVSCGAGCVDCTALQAVDAAICSAGVCVIEVCRGGFSDCDGRVDTGCEQQESDRFCGATCDDCTDRAGTVGGTCEAGICALSCDAGKLDCDAQIVNGCETDESLNACGASCVDCSTLDNVAVSACAAGSCEIAECAFGFVDCNGDASDGCESMVDDNACGPTCDTDCDAQPGVAQGKCTGAACVAVECQLGFRDADGGADCEVACALGECWDDDAPRSFRALSENGSDTVALAGSSAGVVYYTDDSGATWYPRETSLSDVVVDVERSGNLVFAIDSGSRATRSTDAGLTWQTVLLPVGNGTLDGVTIDGDRVFIYGNGRLLRSTDRGENFVDIIGNIAAGTSITAGLAVNDLLFVGTNTGDVLRSDNEGETFSTLSAATAGALNFLAASDGIVYAGGAGFAIQSADDGLSWTAIGGLPDPQLGWTEIDVEAGFVALVAGAQVAVRYPMEDAFRVVTLAEGGILVDAWLQAGEALLLGRLGGFGVRYETVASDDVEMGEPGYVRRDLYHADNIFGWLVEADDVLLSGGGASGQLFRSADDAITFELIDSATDSTLLAASLPDANEAALAGSLGVVTRSTGDSAATFTRVLVGAPTYGPTDIAHDVATGTTVMTGTSGGGQVIFAGNTTDPNSPQWNIINCPSSACATTLPGGQTTTVTLDGTAAYVGTDSGELLISTTFATDGGNWTPLPLPAPNGGVAAIRASGNDLLVRTGSGAGNQVWYSPDAGAGWPDSMSPAPAFTEPTASVNGWAFDGAVGYLVGTGSLVAKTEDAGATWTTIDTSMLTPTTLRWVVVEGAAVVALASNGIVFYSTDAGLTWSETSIDLRGQGIGDVSLDQGRLVVVANRGQVRRSVAGQ